MRSVNVDLMLTQRRRRWVNIKPALDKWLLFRAVGGPKLEVGGSKFKMNPHLLDPPLHGNMVSMEWWRDV